MPKRKVRRDVLEKTVFGILDAVYRKWPGITRKWIRNKVSEMLKEKGTES